MDALTLNKDWDLSVDSQNNISMIAGPGAVAQNVASACRTFQGEVYYDTDLGIPYRVKVFGVSAQPSLLSSFFESTAKNVSDVTDVKVNIALNSDREVTGSILLNGAAEIKIS